MLSEKHPTKNFLAVKELLNLNLKSKTDLASNFKGNGIYFK